MDLKSFKESLTEKQPPAGLSVYLQAFWHDARGDWDKAHELIQDLPDNKAAWIHAYLHRKEGDIGNAGYWYNRAGKSRFTGSLEKEWAEISEAFL